MIILQKRQIRSASKAGRFVTYFQDLDEPRRRRGEPIVAQDSLQGGFGVSEVGIRIVVPLQRLAEVPPSPFSRSSRPRRNAVCQQPIGCVRVPKVIVREVKVETSTIVVIRDIVWVSR